jgi:hypothetical protein
MTGTTRAGVAGVLLSVGAPFKAVWVPSLTRVVKTKVVTSGASATFAICNKAWYRGGNSDPKRSSYLNDILYTPREGPCVASDGPEYGSVRVRERAWHVIHTPILAEQLGGVDKSAFPWRRRNVKH